MDLGIDDCRQLLREARDRFRAACFAPWSRGNSLEIEDQRSSVTFYERRLHEAIQAQAARDARTAQAESLDNGRETDAAGPYWP